MWQFGVCAAAPTEQRQSRLSAVAVICNESKAENDIFDIFYLLLLLLLLLHFSCSVSLSRKRKQIRATTAATACGESEGAGGGGAGRHRAKFEAQLMGKQGRCLVCT